MANIGCASSKTAIAPSPHRHAGITFVANSSIDRLTVAIPRGLAEPAFRQGAALVQRSFREAGGVNEAADAILTFTRSRRK